MSKLTARKFIVAAAATLAMGGSMLTTAEAINETNVTTKAVVNTATVKYSDLNLSTVAGKQTLFFRVRSAAHEVCGKPGYTQTRSLSNAVETKACVNQAIDNAMAQAAAGQVAMVTR